MSIPRLFKVEAGFGSAATDPVPRWSDITGHVASLSTRRGRSYELDRIEAGQATITLDNADGWFTPGRNLGPYAGKLATRLPIRAYTVLDDNWVHHDCVNPDGVDMTTVRWNTRYVYNGTVDMFVVAARVTDTLLGRAVFELGESHGNEPDIVHIAGLFGDADVMHVNTGDMITVDVDVRPMSGGGQAAAAMFFMPYNGAPGDELYAQGNLATSTTAWTHSTLTYTAPAAGYIRAGVYSNGASPKIRVANMKLRRGGIGSATVAGVSGVFPIFRGFVERYTTRAGFTPTTELSCVDALSVFLSRPLETYHRDLVRRFAADPGNAPHIASMHYWPCVESAESTTAIPTLGNIPLVLRHNVTGDGERPAFGSTKTMAHADGMTSGGFTNTGPDPSHGGVLSINHNSTPALPRGRSVGVSLWYRGPLPPAGQVWQLFAALNTSTNDVIGIELEDDGFVRFFYSGNGITTDLARTVGTVRADIPTHVGAVINVEPDNKTYLICFVDGDAFGQNPQPAPNPLPAIAFTQFGGILTPARAERFIRATIGHIMWITSNQVSLLPPTEDLLHEASAWGASQPVHEARPAPRDHTTDPGLLDLNLNAVGWAGSRMLDPGLTLLLAPRWDHGAIASDVIGDAAVSASGLFFAGPAGEMTYHNRSRRANAPIRWRIAEWTDELAFDLDDQKVYNHITVERSTGMTRTARDEPSINTLGVKALKVTCDANDPDELAATASRLLQRYRRAVPRCHTLTIDATALTAPQDNQVIGLAHGAEISDRLIVENLPITAPADALDLFIEGVAHDITPDGQVLRWRTTLQVSDASAWR